jgi:hypothetical protein
MDEKLLIQDRISIQPLEQQENIIQLAKISVSNYIMHLNNREKIEIPSSHKKFVEIKKNTDKIVSTDKYHLLMNDLNRLLDEARASKDVRMLKEVVHFSQGVECVIFEGSNSVK